MVNTINELVERNKQLLNETEQLKENLRVEIWGAVGFRTSKNIWFRNLKEKWIEEGRIRMVKDPNHPNPMFRDYERAWFDDHDVEKMFKEFCEYAMHLEDWQYKTMKEKNNLEREIKDTITKYQKIIEELNKYKEQVENLAKNIEELLLDYSELSEEDIENERIYWQIDEPEELSEKLKNNGLKELNEVIMRIIEKWEVDAKTHFVYLVEVSKLFNEKKVEGLKEEIEEKSVLLEKRDKRINEEVLKSAKLQEGLEQKEEDLRNRDKKLEIEKKEKEELKWQLYLERKTLPTLPKKENKLKQLGVKIKSNFQQLIKWGKNQKQEFISRIEVKAK